MRLMSFYTADREVWERRNKNALLDIHAAVRIDDPAHDDLFWPEVFQKPAEVHQRDVRIPVDHVHEKSGNMEAGAYGLRAVLVLLRMAPAAAVGRPHPVRDRAQCGDDRVCRVDHRIPPARPDALRAPGHGTRAAEKV